MAVTSLLAFWGVAMLLIVVPGADWAFTVDAGVRRTVLPAVGGLVIGYLLVTAVVATGVGVLVASTPTALGALTVVGGTYLIWRGVTTIRHPSTGPRPGDGPDTAMTARTPWATVRRGIGVSGLNPKGLLLFLALLPQFTSQGAPWSVTVQIGVLGLAFVATSAVFYLALGAVAARALASRPGLARSVSRLAGAGMTVVGALLLAEHLLP